MAVLVVGGSGRGAGKTAVACALLAATPQVRWAAVKVSPHGHGLPLGVTEEWDRSSDKDTGRYLAAGALRAFLLTRGLDGAADHLREDVLRIRQTAAECDGLLVESNRLDWRSLAADGETGLTLVVLDESWAKDSLADAVARADGLIQLRDAGSTTLPAAPGGRPVFFLSPGEGTMPEIVEFARKRLLV